MEKRDVTDERIMEPKPYPPVPDSGESDIYPQRKNVPTETRKQPSVLSATTIIGDRVLNMVGEQLGEIKELMIDLKRGCIAYAVLSFGGFLGIGDKLFAVPWKSLSLRIQDHAFILDVDKEKLQKAPGFDKDNWPDMDDLKWGGEVHSYYGSRPYWEE